MAKQAFSGEMGLKNNPPTGKTSHNTRGSHVKTVSVPMSTETTGLKGGTHSATRGAQDRSNPSLGVGVHWQQDASKHQ